MAHRYITIAELKSYALPELNIDDDEQVAAAELLIESVSAFVDRHCKRPDEYFSPAAADATVRRFRGEGQDYLRIGKHVGPAAVTNPAVSASVLYESGNGWLRWSQQATNGDDDFLATIAGGFFRRDQVYSVSARWGFASTPADIKQAVALIVGEIHERGKGVIGEISPAGFVIEREMPLQARAILRPWIRREFEIN